MSKQHRQALPRVLRHTGHTTPEAAYLALISAIGQEFPKLAGEQEQAYQKRLRATAVTIVSREGSILVRDDTGGTND